MPPRLQVLAGNINQVGKAMDAALRKPTPQVKAHYEKEVQQLYDQVNNLYILKRETALVQMQADLRAQVDILRSQLENILVTIGGTGCILNVPL